MKGDVFIRRIYNKMDIFSSWRQKDEKRLFFGVKMKMLFYSLFDRLRIFDVYLVGNKEGYLVPMI